MPPKRRKLGDGLEDNQASDDMDFDPVNAIKQDEEQQRINLGKRRYDQQNSLENMLRTKGPKIDELIKEKEMYPFKDQKLMQQRAAHGQNKHTNPEFVFTQRGKHSRTLKQMQTNDPYSDQLGSYQSIEAGISTRPAKKYCDFHGFIAKYTCPRTGLRFCCSQELVTADTRRPATIHQLQLLADSVRDEYLEIRKAKVILK